MLKHRTLAFLLFAVTTVLLLAGCSAVQGPSPLGTAPTSAPSPAIQLPPATSTLAAATPLLTATVVSSSTAQAAPPTTATASATPRAVTPSSEIAAVTIKDFAFTLNELTIQPGTTVTWTNDDTVTHTVFVVDGPEKFDSRDILTGAQFSFRFTQPGTYVYYCGYHDIMMGTITVAP